MPDRPSRRDLIAAAGVTAALVPAAAKAQAKEPPVPESEKIGFAIVGLGKLSLTQLIPALKKTRTAKLAAVVSGHPEKARRVAAENGLPADAV